MNMQFTLQRYWNLCKKAERGGVHSTPWPPLWLLISQAFRGTSTILDTAPAYSSLFFSDKFDVWTSGKHTVDVDVWLLSKDAEFNLLWIQVLKGLVDSLVGS